MSESSRATHVQADPLVPHHGDPSYAVDHYDLALTWKHVGNYLSGRATLRVRLLEPTRRLVLDLHALTVSKLTVSGARLDRWTHRAGRLALRLTAEHPAGTELVVTVAYGGVPRQVPGPDGPAGWEELADGLIVASQPYGAPSWFPCNDRPSDKASYRIAVSAASDYVVVANGVLRERRSRSSRTTWVYEMSQPMATYLATVQIGRYDVRPLALGPVPVAVVHPARLTDAVVAGFARQVEMVETFTRLFGPYPFDTYTVVVTDDPLEIPLESQSLSTFGSNGIATHWGSQRLIAHELSHQWFGNSLTLRRWADIWLHEGFACYAEWIWSQESGGESTAVQARRHWQRLEASPQDLVLTDPGPTELFDDRVYKRGALTLHAVRLALGDELFFAVLREWVESRRHGSVGTADFVTVVSAAASALAPGGEARMRDLLHRWLDTPKLPSLPT